MFDIAVLQLQCRHRVQLMVLRVRMLAIFVKDRGCCVWWEGIGAIPFLSGRKWITRQSFLDSFSSASRRWTINYVGPTAVGSDEEPATGANFTSGRAISGSGLGATPVFQGEFPRLKLPQNDRHAIAIAEPYQWV